MTAPLPQRHDDPPIRLKLNEETYDRGDRAKVKVRAANDGYLLVLRGDADGRIRVLFPIAPDDDARIKGGKEFEVRSRGDREAFTVNESAGAGTVLAVWSESPLNFQDFTRNGRWDYRALSADSSSGADEAGLLDLVDRMTDGKYTYDVAEYSVEDSPPARPHYRVGFYSGYYDPWWGYYGPRWRVGIGWGGGWHRRW
ncbi:MAG TPA: DUF4384 domain-containing protein [Gemmatimonadales bacterium]|nr:DUF4384 domain-containing protein [Gemmatimonadales bacterium]